MDLSPDDLRAIRQDRGETQEAFADYVNRAVGRRYDKSSVSRWERGLEAVPSIVRLFLQAEKARVAGTAPQDDAPALRLTRPVVIALANQKGGVGKTTSAINLGYAFAKAGYRTLIVDCDHQANATAGLGMDNFDLDQRGVTLAKPMLQDAPLETVVLEARDDIPLYLVPAGYGLAEADQVLATEIGGERILAEKLGEIGERFDFILLDCPPHLGAMTVNALSAATWVLLPTETEPWSTRGIPMMLRTIDRVRKRINPRLDVLGLLPTRYAPREVQHQDTLQELQDLFGGKFHLFTPIERGTQYGQAAAAGKPMLESFLRTKGAEAYAQLATEIVTLLQTRETGAAA